MIPRLISYLAAALFGAAACMGVDQVEFVARILTAGEEALVTVPERVAVDQSFEVTVLSFHGCRVEPGSVSVAIGGLLATVTPYDFRDMTNPNCPSFEREVLRRAQVQFNQAGTGTVAFVGTGLDDELIEVVRMVTVSR